MKRKIIKNKNTMDNKLKAKIFTVLYAMWLGFSLYKGYDVYSTIGFLVIWIHLWNKENCKPKKKEPKELYDCGTCKDKALRYQDCPDCGLKMTWPDTE